MMKWFCSVLLLSSTIAQGQSLAYLTHENHFYRKCAIEFLSCFNLDDHQTQQTIIGFLEQRIERCDQALKGEIAEEREITFLYPDLIASCAVRNHCIFSGYSYLIGRFAEQVQMLGILGILHNLGLSGLHLTPNEQSIRNPEYYRKAMLHEGRKFAKVTKYLLTDKLENLQQRCAQQRAQSNTLLQFMLS